MNSEESNEFIEKSDAEKLFNHEEAWIRIYKELVKTLSINKDADYKKRVMELKN